jgi:hypothetical protein
MKSAIIPSALVLIVALSSCSTAYKTGQTPDDVYYSAATPQKEEKRTETEERRDYTYTDDYYDDRYLQMKVRNRYRWNDLNDWYSYDRYSYGYNYAWGSFYNPYNTWNYYYNPYCCCHGNMAFNNPKQVSFRPQVKPHNFNLGGYTNTSYNIRNVNTGKTAVRTTNTRPVYNNSNNNNSGGKGLSNTIRTIFSGNENNNNSGSSGSNGGGRTYTPSSSNSGSSSSGSSSSGSSGSSGGGVSRPVRN